jgi:hypothetical protein
MFGYAVGLLLPSSIICDQLLQRPEVLKHVADALKQQVASIPNAQLTVWWLCADGRPPSPALASALVSMQPAGQVLGQGPESLTEGGLELWLRHSQAVIHLRFPEDPHGASCPQHDWLRQRLLPSVVRPAWHTRDLLIDPEADRPSHQHAYHGCTPLPGDMQRFSALQELHNQLTPTANELGPLARSPMAWLIERCHRARRRSDQRLMRQAILLAAVVEAARWAVPSLALSILLLLAGAWWMARQPWRHCSQQWWCLDHLLWVQDLWQRFGLRDCPAERAHPLPPAPRGQRPLDLTAALRSHQLWLWMQPEPPVWGRPALTDCLDALQAHQRDLQDVGRDQRQRQRGVRLLLALGAVLTVLAIVSSDSRLVEQLLLLVGVLVVATGLATPIPLLRSERLLQHLSRLGEECTDLERGQRAEALTDPKLRASVEAAVRRIGIEIADLCDDALLAGRDWRRWLP